MNPNTSSTPAVANVTIQENVATAVNNNPSPPQKRSFNSSSNNTRSPAPKKHRFTSTVTNRRGGTSYSKQNDITTLSSTPTLPFFPVYVSNLGCRTLAELVLACIRGRDYRIATAIPLLQLVYVTIIAYCNRVVQVSTESGYAKPSFASRLKSVAKGIMLPDVLAKYIETIGLVTCANGIVIAPWAANYEEMFPDGTDMMIDPATILQEADRPIPPGDWCIDVAWILAYNASTSRGARTGMKFRVVEDNSFVGDVKMLVSWTNEAPFIGEVTPYCPERISRAEMALGAAYQFRCYTDIRAWFGTHKQLLYRSFTTAPVNPATLVNDICVASFSGAMP